MNWGLRGGPGPSSQACSSGRGPGLGARGLADRSSLSGRLMPQSSRDNGLVPRSASPGPLRTAAAATSVMAIGRGPDDQVLQPGGPWIRPIGGPRGSKPVDRGSERMGDREKAPKLVKVRLSVHYRVHSRQMLCIGGSQIPFGWSFLSIAKVPMTWNQGDVWQAEVMLPAGQRIEYKYVILEEQDWTKLENEDAEGLVEVTYRSGTEPGRPPDVTVIQKQMAIVAWQPGPNRVVKVPTEEELNGLRPGDEVPRVPARAPVRSSLEPQQPDPLEGTRETLTVGEDGEPLVDRIDVWGWAPPPTGRPPNMRGLRFDN